MNGTGVALYGAWVSLGAADESSDADGDTGGTGGTGDTAGVRRDTGGAGDTEPPRCSAKACRAAASIDLIWRNPGLHDSTRTKHWLACGEHADRLADFLGRRGFLLGRGPLVDPAGRDGS